jgi:hypothetical protein
MNEVDGDSPFADRGGHALDVAGTDIANGEDTGKTSL